MHLKHQTINGVQIEVQIEVQRTREVFLQNMYPITFIKFYCREWIFGEFYCTVNNFIAYMSVAVSVFSLVAIAIDRFVFFNFNTKETRLKKTLVRKRGLGQ